MPKQAALKRARRDAAQGKSASTQAGEFVREEIDSIRRGEHGARSPKQAIAIALSEARRAGVPLAPPKKGAASSAVRKKAKRDLAAAKSGRKPNPTRSKATLKALKKEGRGAASHAALSRQAKSVAKKRGPKARATSARKAAKTRKRK